MAQTAREALEVARRHLARVDDAWAEPDWADLALYGFHCLEACVVAAAELQLAALTHRARAALSSAGVFPQSRPELAAQLRRVGEDALAERLGEALARRSLLSQPHNTRTRSSSSHRSVAVTRGTA